MSVLALAGELTIMTAADRKTELLTAVSRRKSVELDLSEITELDTAGLQVLLLARREAAEVGKSFTLVSPSPAVLEALEICWLSPSSLDPIGAPA